MVYLLLGLMGAAAATAYSLYLSLGLGLTPCPGCVLVRAVAIGLTGLLAVGALALRNRPAEVCLAALPLTLMGLGVAGYQVWHELTIWPRHRAGWHLACPLGLGGIGTVPQQTFVIFGVTTWLLAAGVVGELRRGKQEPATFVVSVLLGIAGTVAAVGVDPPWASSPPGVNQVCHPVRR